MTIRFLTAWNGYAEGAIATLTEAQETLLIAGQIAQNYSTNQTLGCLGDSIMQRGMPYSDANNSNLEYSRSISAWAQALAGVKPDFRNYSQGGISTDTAIATYLPQAIRDKPTACLVLVGTNDIATGGKSATYVAENLKTIVNTLVAAGTYAILIGLLPNLTNADAAEAFAAVKVNQIIQTWIKSTYNDSQAVYIDGYSVCLDNGYTTTTNQIPTWETGYSHDTTHPDGPAAYAIARLIAPYLAQKITPISLVSSTADAYENNTGSSTINNNPLFTGSGGTLGAGCTGTVPRAWSTLCTGGATCAFSVAKANSECGNKVILDVTTTAAGEVYLYQTGLAAARAPDGSILQASCQAKIVTPGPLTHPRVGWYDGVKQTYFGWEADSSYTDSYPYPSQGEPLAIATHPRMASNPTAYQIYFRASFGGAGTAQIEVERFALKK